MTRIADTTLRSPAKSAAWAAVAVAGALLAAPSWAATDVAAPSGAYALDPTHANIIFQVDHLGLAPYTARFDRFDASLTLDVDAPANSAVTATIQADSVSTNYPGDKDFNGEIARGEKFLNAGSFPEITFTSKSIETTGPTTATITGDLTMLGVTQEVTMEAELTGSLAQHPFAGGKPAVAFVAEGSLDRTAFGFTNLTQTMPQLAGAPIVAPEVTFMIQAEFVKAD